MYTSRKVYINFHISTSLGSGVTQGGGDETFLVHGRTDRHTDRKTDGRTDRSAYRGGAHLKMNYKGNPSYENSLWKCSECGNQDTSSHLLWCSGYSEQREGLDLESDHDLCKYLQKIITLRCKDAKK